MKFWEKFQKYPFPGFVLFSNFKPYFQNYSKFEKMFSMKVVWFVKLNISYMGRFSSSLEKSKVILKLLSRVLSPFKLFSNFKYFPLKISKSFLSTRTGPLAPCSGQSK